MPIRSIVFALMIISLPAAVGADICWRGRPRPECDSFWITEFGVGWRQSNVSNRFRSEEVSDSQIRYELGHMFNVGSKLAIGGTLSATGHQEGHFGLNGRVRFWLDRNWSLDLEPGMIFYSSADNDHYSLRSPAASGRIILNYADFVGVYAELEQVRIEGEESDLDLYLGVHAASYPGAALGSVFLIMGIIAAASGGLGAIQ